MPCCCAVNCSNRSERGYRMMRFPRDKKRRELWLQVMGRANWSPSRYSVICEAHFDPSQFENNRQDGRKLLKNNAVPLLFFHSLQRKDIPDSENDEKPIIYVESKCIRNDYSFFKHPQSNVENAESNYNTSFTVITRTSSGINKCIKLNSKRKKDKKINFEDTQFELYKSGGRKKTKSDPGITNIGHQNDKSLKALPEPKSPVILKLFKRMSQNYSKQTNETTLNTSQNEVDLGMKVDNCDVQIQDNEQSNNPIIQEDINKNQYSIKRKSARSKVLRKQYTSLKTFQHEFQTHHQDRITNLTETSSTFPLSSPTLNCYSYNIPRNLHSNVTNGKINQNTQSDDPQHRCIENKLHEHLMQLEREHYDMKREIAKLTKANACLFENFNELFNEDQKKILNKEEDINKIKWSQETIDKAVQVYAACGSSGYKFLLSQGFPFPSWKALNNVSPKIESKHPTDEEIMLYVTV